MLLPDDVCHDSLLFRMSLVVKNQKKKKKRQGEAGEWASVSGKETGPAIREFL